MCTDRQTDRRIIGYATVYGFNGAQKSDGMRSDHGQVILSWTSQLLQDLLITSSYLQAITESSSSCDVRDRITW